MFLADSISVDAASTYLPGRQPGPSAASRESFCLIKNWLHKCTSTHSECPSPKNVPLPTRIINVVGNASSGNPYLVVSQIQDVGTYAALSYCWGTSQTNISTKATLSEKTNEISLLSLPHTILDAITVTKELGIQYLWVDALCIIQDSTEDWQSESSKMGQIYNNALVTIQASGTDHCNGGCFLLRDPVRFAHVKLPFRSSDGILSSVFVRYEPLRYDPLSGLGEVNHLQKRGWTLQEGLLSPRILSFGAKQLSWECTSIYADEAGSVLAQQKFYAGLPKPIRTPTKLHAIPVEVDTASSEMSVQLTWSYILQDYAKRTLSYQKDKLPALSGLARHLSTTRAGDEYCAGLWKNDMPLNLLWGVTSKGKKPTAYRAPSWSWASLDGELAVFDRPFRQTDVMCKVLDVSVTPAGLDPFGEVAGGLIKLYGQLKQIWRMLDQHTFLYGDKEVQPIYDQNHRSTTQDNHRGLKLGLCELDIFDSSQCPDVPVLMWCFRITDSEGLILQKMLDGRFQRIGCFQLDEQNMNWFDDVDSQTVMII